MGFNNTPKKIARYIPNDEFFDEREKEVWEDVGQRVGHLTEEQFIEALNPKEDLSFKLPGWFVSARLGTFKEDNRGIDIVVETADLGCFFIQLKSSQTNVHKFLLRQGKTRIAVIVILPQDSVVTIRRKFFEAAQLERSWLRERRSGGRPPRTPTVITW